MKTNLLLLLSFRGVTSTIYLCRFGLLCVGVVSVARVSLGFISLNSYMHIDKL